jgi:hypothetical protein
MRKVYGFLLSFSCWPMLAGPQTVTQSCYNGYPSGCRAEAIAVDGSGNVYVAGEARNGSPAALVVAKYTTNAQQFWMSIFDSCGRRGLVQ